MPNLLAVVHPGEGCNALKGFKDELNNLQTFSAPITVLEESKATSTEVIKQLKSHEWAHFICHGHLAEHPFESSLQLHGAERLTLNSIIKANLPKAQFAFLAACHSAEESPNPLQDEIFHLAGAMQFSGYRSVVGVIWAVQDKDGPLVAKEFYAEMLAADSFRSRVTRAILLSAPGRFRSGVKLLPTSLFALLRRWSGIGADGREIERHERAAYALWHATKKLRKRCKASELERWVNFIHMGA